MDLSVVIAYLLGIFILYTIARLLLVPLKALARLIINSVAGGLVLAIVNLIGGYFGLYLAINPITVLVAGLLGLPGIILMIAIRYWIVGF